MLGFFVSINAGNFENSEFDENVSLFFWLFWVLWFSQQFFLLFFPNVRQSIVAQLCVKLFKHFLNQLAEFVRTSLYWVILTAMRVSRF